MKAHSDICPLPDSYHRLNQVIKIKCAGLLYVLYSIKPKQGQYDLEELKVKYRVQLGNEPCAYCGEPAKHYIKGHSCCMPKAPQCPNYTKVIGDRFRKLYEEKPEWKENMSKSLLISQNKPEVKAAKSAAMIRLHNEQCDECITFQKNYHSSPVGRHKNRNQRE